MKKWQEQCNYRKIKDSSGKVIDYMIRIGDSWISVAEDTYKLYAQMGRQERYQNEKTADVQVMSFEKLMEDHVPIDIYMVRHLPSAEDIAIAGENDKEQQALIARLAQVLSQLTEEERMLIQAIYFDNVSIRAYARQCGISTMTLHYRLQKTLKILREKLE